MDPYLIPHEKINSEWIKNLNVTAKIVKLFKKKTGRNLCELGVGNSFLVVTPKAQATTGKTDKLDLIKIRSFASKDTTKESEKTRNPQNGENVCKSHI